MANSTIKAAQEIDKASKAQTSQGALLQTYCNSVLAQPEVDFKETPNLVKYQKGINDGLGIAKGHANEYLNKIQPLIFSNIANISNYYALHNAVATTLPPGSTERQWVEQLNILKDQSIQFHYDANNVITQLQTLHQNLGVDTASFAKIVSDLNGAVNGDNGVLQSIDGQLGKLQGDIDGAIAGIALSGLAILGGVFLTALGAIGEIFTGGAATALVVGGIGLVVVGVGGEVASAVMLQKLNEAKADLLKNKASLKNEVKLALGMSSAYGSLKGQSLAAMNAATQMGNAWQFLSGDLSNLISDLEKGITSADKVRMLFLTAANSVIKDVANDTNIIKGQMAGVKGFKTPKGEYVGPFFTKTVKEYMAAS